MKDVPRFLVLRGGAIGDFLLTLPALQALRERWPKAYVEIIGYPHIANLALAGDLADHIDSLDRAEMVHFFSPKPSFSPRQAEHIASFDVIISFLHDPGGTVRNNLELAGAKQVIYGSPLVKEGHASAHLAKPLEALALYAQDTPPCLRLREDVRARGRAWLRERGLTHPWVLHPGSGNPAKNWPVDRYVALLRRLWTPGERVVISLGEADHALRPVFQSLDNEAVMMEDLTLTDVAAVLSEARGYVGNDTGISHLAAALSIPTIALFGPTDPALWGPRGACVTILRAPEGDWRQLTVNEVERRCLRGPAEDKADDIRG